MNQDNENDQVDVTHKNCRVFFSKLTDSSIYPDIKNLLLEWRNDDKKNIAAINTFMQISHIVHEQARDQRLSQSFNNCLIKQAIVPKKNINNSNNSNQNIELISQSISNNLKNQQNAKPTRKQTPKVSKQSQKQKYNDENQDGEQDDDGFMEDNESEYQARYRAHQAYKNSQKDHNGINKLQNMMKNKSLYQKRQILQNLGKWMKKQSQVSKQDKVKHQRQKRQYNIQNKQNSSAFEPLSAQSFKVQLSKINYSSQILKVMSLYLKSIMNFQEVKSSLIQINFHQLHPPLYHYLIKICQETESKRQKVTIFAPLNQLVDKKYPLQQVGSSYIIIPDGYANYSKTWSKMPNQHLLNRKYVSVPLGSEVNFVINKKTQYQQQLFNNQQQRYEIDHTLQCLNLCIKLIRKYQNRPNITPKIQNPVLKRIVSQLYPTIENIYSIFINYYQLAVEILLPRLQKKYAELIQLREKSKKASQEIAAKNFYKSLDYRCYYFVKNDKNFNCPTRWLQEIFMKKNQIQQENKSIQQKKAENKIEPLSRQKLQHSRNYYVNSYENVTTLPLMPEKFVQMSQFERKYQAKYPKYPDNQILFILNFQNHGVLNDILQILLYHCNQNKKRLLQLLVFRIMRLEIKRKLRKYNKAPSSPKPPKERNRENVQNNQNSNSDSQDEESYEVLKVNHQNSSYLINDNNHRLLTTRGVNNSTRDSDDQFMDLIEQQNEATFIDNSENNPFQGPEDGYNFIGTKTMYILVRYILTIYQRFLKAKQFSLQNQTQERYTQNSQQTFEKYPTNYKHFISLYTAKSLTTNNAVYSNHKLKQKKNIQEQLRKLFQNNAFIFFTVQKLLQSAIKLINSINNQSLTYKILKDGTKDYQHGIFQWDNFQWKNTNQQLIRLYQSGIIDKNEKQAVDNQPQNKANDILFRFTYQYKHSNCYISAWKPILDGTCTKQNAIKIRKNMNSVTPHKTLWNNSTIPAIVRQQNEETILLNDELIIRGQSNIVRPQRKNLLNSVEQRRQKILKFQIAGNFFKQKPTEELIEVKKVQDTNMSTKYISKDIEKLKNVHKRYLY